MKLRPESAAMTVMLAVLISMGPLSTDMYLPSLPWIARDLGASDKGAQLTLSMFLVGFAIGQIVYGPISDTFGRKPVLLSGLGLFLAATLACAMSRSIELLIAARFCQAVGACAAVVLARAIVRDLFEAERAARTLSFMGALMGAVPAVAPILGAVLQTTFGWRATFAAVAMIGVVILLAVVFCLPETLKARPSAPLTFRSLFASFATLIRNRDYRRYVYATGFSYGGLFAFISGSSFVFQNHYGLSVRAFGFVFATAVIGYISGTLLGARLTTRHGIEHTLRIGAAALAIGGMTMLALVGFGPESFWQVLAPMVVYTAGVGLTMPQSMAGALTPFPDRAGAAASLLGFVQMTFGAMVGIGVGQTLNHGSWALTIAIAALSLLNLALIIRHPLRQG